MSEAEHIEEINVPWQLVAANEQLAINRETLTAGLSVVAND